MINVRITLTYSEYREFQRRRLRFPNRSATIGLAVIFALLSVLLLASGLQLIDDTNAVRIGLWMVIGSIVMVAAIPFFVLWRKKRDQQKSEQMLRAEFENIKHEVREFEADEQGWKFRWRGGEDIRPWNLFRGLWDDDLAVRLASSYNEYWLPKRTFTPEQFAELKSLVDKIMSRGKANASISVCSRPTALDFTAGQASRQWQYRYHGVLLIGMLVASAGFIVDQAVHWAQPGSDTGGITLAICCFAFSFWNLVIPFRHYEHYREFVSQRPESFIAVSDDGIYLDSPGLQTRIAYELVQKLVEARFLSL